MSVLSDEDNSTYARYQALELRYRGIIRHLVLSLAAGAAAGVLGTLVHVAGLGAVERAFDPYAYFALTLIVGRTAAGFGWALLTSALAALAPMIPSLAEVGATGHDAQALGGDPATLNLLVLALVGAGLAGQAARAPGLPGDAAAGVACGVLLAEIGARALFGPAVQEFRPWPALAAAALLLGLLVAVRRTPRSRLRALAVAALVAGGGLAALAAFG